MLNIKILVAYHKKSLVISNDVYVPIHVGKFNSKLNLPTCIGDDVGDNISNQNAIYCEMTAAYWGWKNIKADYIGLCHYRRFLYLEEKKCKLNTLKSIFYTVIRNSRIAKFFLRDAIFNEIIIDDENIFQKKCHSSSEEIKKILVNEDIDVITPFPVILPSGNVYSYFSILGIQNINRLVEIINDSYPSYSKFMHQCLYGNKLYYANMHVMKYDIYCDYSEFIFSFLEEYKIRSLKANYCINFNEGCYSRLLGYISEILTDIYLKKLISNKKKIKEAKVLFLNN